MPSRCVLVMGVAGSGKSAVAGRLAQAIGGSFVEADDHHPAANVARMAAGLPLTDEMRWPWLEAVASAALAAPPGPVVVACSALRRSYRDLLRERLGALPILHLHGTSALLAERLQSRQGHFAGVGLLDSQLATLEPPGVDEKALVLDIALHPDTLCHLAHSHLQTLATAGQAML
ncbi:gluconokinase [Gemmobacter aquaticus]|uniref:Gluconokinase n=1 Tax=Gemmobacter aquaticus TaxID=490185 RepID=A0A917YQM9_9RHOB|nr:gluconokinase [Gemmobacter aquaticus]GGO38576.1 gluconokinase [Gemmobacter aquaticus]